MTLGFATGNDRLGAHDLNGAKGKLIHELLIHELEQSVADGEGVDSPPMGRLITLLP
jgi:hypothetical protein